MYDYDKVQNILTTKYIGQTFVQFDDIKSTNLKAKNIITGNFLDGMLVLTQNQENLKLKNNRVWYALDGEGLYMSIILKQTDDTNKSSQIIQIANAAIIKAFEKMFNSNKFTIKWPNDIMYNNKKVASTFTELVKRKSEESCIILSIFVNLSFSEDELEDNDESNFIKTSCSLKDISKDDFDKEELIGYILNELEIYYEEIKENENITKSLNVFRENNNIINKIIEIQRINKKTIKRVRAVDIVEDGNLLVCDDKGNLNIITQGQETICGGYNE